MVVRVLSGCYGDHQSWYREATNGNGTAFHGQGVNLLKSMIDIFEARNETVEFVTDFEEEVLRTGNGTNYDHLITEVKGFQQGIFDLDMLHYTLTSARFPHVENFMP